MSVILVYYKTVEVFFIIKKIKGKTYEKNLVVFLFFVGTLFLFVSPTEAAMTPSVFYRTHTQTVGWQGLFQTMLNQVRLVKHDD
ncbi:hypothetical protein RyT2_02350 [Pseudolactococcus yaeyamensis]